MQASPADGVVLSTTALAKYSGFMQEADREYPVIHVGTVKVYPKVCLDVMSNSVPPASLSFLRMWEM